MKTKMFTILKMSAKRRAIDFYSAQVEGDPDSFGAFLQRSEALIRDLKFIMSKVRPCFPPSYNIFDLHFNVYKQELHDRIENLLKGPKIDKILTEDPQAILAFSAFVSTCQ